MTKKLLFAVLSIAVIIICSASAFAVQTGDLSAVPLEKEQIREKYNALTLTDEIFDVSPALKAPYNAGVLNSSFINTGVSELNFVRMLAHLPQVSLNSSYNTLAQHGAALMAANDKMTHYPEQPDDMSDEFYEKGYSATSTSNIYRSYGYSEKITLKQAVRLFMSDSDINNIEALGHRRWFLSPGFTETGFGYAQSASGSRYVAAKVINSASVQGAAVDYECIAWPSGGNFPSEYFSANDAWSVSLNPQKYRTPLKSEVIVTLTRESDKTVWSFTQDTESSAVRGAAFFNVNTSRYGINNCIIFRPDFDTYNHAYFGNYTVKIEGIKTLGGEDASLSYTVSFFPVEECETHTYVKSGVISAPSCTADGKTEYTCSVCGSTVLLTEAATGHAFDEGEITLAPTDISTGILTRTCGVCGEKTESVIPKTVPDGVKLTSADARTALRISVGLEEVPPELFGFYDIDGDNKISAADARIILRKAVGLE